MFEIFKRVANHEPDVFVAPIPPVHSVTVFSRQDNIPYKFDVHPNGRSGWFKIRPVNKRSAQIGEEADRREIEQFLRGLPSFYCIAVYGSGGTWVVTPFNNSDAKQRGWAGDPRYMYLSNENIRPLQLVRAVQVGAMFVYQKTGLFSMTHNAIWNALEEGKEYAQDDPNIPKNLRLPVAIVQERARIQREIERLAEEEELRRLKLAQIKTQATDLEGRIRQQLGIMNAELVDWKKINRDNIAVTFKHEGAEWTLKMVDPKSLHVNLIGFCVSGHDHDLSIAAAVETFYRARQEHRFDLNRSLYLGDGVVPRDYDDDDDYDD